MRALLAGDERQAPTRLTIRSPTQEHRQGDCAYLRPRVRKVGIAIVRSTPNFERNTIVIFAVDRRAALMLLRRRQQPGCLGNETYLRHG
jgi:hypothetical protein